jgi:Protein of unknown function (DUF434)
MPNRRRHRGPHPEDAVLFGDPAHLHKLALAAGDLAWLLGRHYAPKAALTLVGNRYQLHQRQRRALTHAVASPEVARQRGQHRITPPALAGQRLQVDALNQMDLLEAVREETLRDAKRLEGMPPQVAEHANRRHGAKPSSRSRRPSWALADQ